MKVPTYTIIRKLEYSRVLHKHVGLNKHIGGKIFENQIIVLVGINMLVRFCKWDSPSTSYRNVRCGSTRFTQI